MKISRDIVVPHDENGRGVFPGFIRYIDAKKPILFHRYGRVDGSDAYDDFLDCLSTDNGLTWSEPEIHLKSQAVEGGRLRYAENAAYFDEPTGKLLTFTSRSVYQDDKPIAANHWAIEFSSYDVKTGEWEAPQVSDFDVPAGLTVSFSFPIKLSSGQVLVPVQKRRVDKQGQLVYMPGYWSPQYEALVLIGQRNSSGKFSWQMSKPATIEAEKSSRGLCEPTIAQLKDGRIAMVCRGDNGFFPEKPGRKWVCFSKDCGESWSAPSPLQGTDGSQYESGANGSALIRSIVNDKLYWVGNLALNNQRANGNWPRSPLVIAEVSEEPFGLVPENLVEIDKQRSGDTDKLQLSNFRYYQDRQTGELCILLTRFGEYDVKQWRKANYYQYRVAIT